MEAQWIREGGIAAVKGRSDTSRVEFATIERLTATRIILADGRRFLRGRGNYQVDSRHGNVYQLLDPTSPEVVTLVARAELLAVLGHVGDLWTVRAVKPVQRLGVEEIREVVADLIARLNAVTERIDQVAAGTPPADQPGK